MHIKIVAHTAVRGWDDERLPVQHKSDMANEPFIKNLVSHSAIVNPTMRLADHTRPRSGCLVFRHVEESPGNREE